MPRKVLVSKPWPLRAATSSSRRRTRTLSARWPSCSVWAPAIAGSCASATPTSASLGTPEAARGGPRGRGADPVRPRRRRRGAREPLPADPGRGPGGAEGGAGVQPRHARRGREGAPPAAVAERPHPPRQGQGPRQLPRARGRRHRRLRPRGGARQRHPPDRGAGDPARAHPAQLLLRPGRRLRRARRRRPRGDGARPRAVQPLPGRRGAARRGRLDPRRRQRRERRLSAGPVRGGVGDRRAGRGGLQADHRGRGDLRRRGLPASLRRLPPAAARVHRARRGDPHLRHNGARQTTTLEALLPRSFGPGSCRGDGGFPPRLGIILGSGLGGIADALTDARASPTPSSRASRSRPSPATAGRCTSASSTACRWRSSPGASTSTRAATRARCASRSARSSSRRGRAARDQRGGKPARRGRAPAG